MSFSPGSAVMVKWSDGNQYPAQVVQLQEGHVLISFPNGQQHWVEQHFVSPSAPAAPAAQAAGGIQVAGGGNVEMAGVQVYESGNEYMQELQGIIQQVESQGVPLPGVDPNDPVTIWNHVFALQKMAGDGIPEEQAVQQLGFSDMEHFRLVQQYVEAKWSHMGTDDEGQPAVVQKPEYQNAMMQASMGQMQQAQADAAGADPNLLAPVGGVSLEQWASASVVLGSLGANATVDDMAQKLAELGLDKASYDSAGEGWMAKMQGDTTGVIAGKYAEAFASAQSGAPAAGAAAGAAAGGAAGGAAAGGEPCTFELYVEIAAAMGAWSEQGFDVNAKAQEVFGIDAITYSGYSTHWGMKMATDMALINKQTELMKQFEQKYAGVDLDADLVL